MQFKQLGRQRRIHRFFDVRNCLAACCHRLILCRYNDYNARGVYIYWGAATALSCIVMGAGLTYIVHEYCTQSHMSTEDYGRAMQGLRMTRWFRKHTRFWRFIPDHTIRLGKLMWWKINGGNSRKTRRSLKWTVNTNDEAVYFATSSSRV